MPQYTLKIRRYDPQSGQAAYWEEHTVELAPHKVAVNAHPAVVDFLKNDERIAVQEAERLFQRRIELVPRKEYHLEQFDLQGR